MRQRAGRLPAAVRREQILDAAITVFARTPYRETATAAIAAELGVSEPTLFRHFSSKRALYLAAIERSADVLLERWRDIAARSESALGALITMGLWYFSELQQDSRHLRLRFRTCTETGDPEIQERARAHFTALFQLIEEQLERARARGEVAAGVDTRSHAWLLMAVGTLLDTTQIVGLRAALPLETLPALVTLALPPRPE